MRLLDWIIPALIVVLLLLVSNYVLADALDETRYCHEVANIPRNSDGKIKRDMSVVKAFKFWHPCPATKRRMGACPGWAVDHVIPLAVGGCDAVANMQWLPNETKSCALLVCKDRYERFIYKREFGQ